MFYRYVVCADVCLEDTGDAVSTLKKSPNHWTELSESRTSNPRLPHRLAEQWLLVLASTSQRDVKSGCSFAGRGGKPEPGLLRSFLSGRPVQYAGSTTGPSYNEKGSHP